MNDNIDLGGSSLVAFFDRIGLPPVARDRVVEIDRILAHELAGDEPDAEGCASLVLEAAGLIADRDRVGFDRRAGIGSRIASSLGVSDGFDRGDGDSRNLHRRVLMTRKRG